MNLTNRNSLFWIPFDVDETVADALAIRAVAANDL